MASTEAHAVRAPVAAWYALAVLALTTFLALLDRQIMLLLAEPVRLELALSDLQLGLLQGAGIALFAALASFPLGWLADRLDRRFVLAGCVALWSAAVVACGLSRSFPALLVSNAMVGVGEAGLAPILYAIIPALFVGRQRQLANSIAALATVGGGALAFIAAGQITAFAASIGPLLPAGLTDLSTWRVSFLVAAMPAPVMILLILSIRLPRPGRPVASPHARALPASDWQYFRRHRLTYLRFYVGAGCGTFAFMAISVWLAIIAARLFAETPAQVGGALGIAQIGSAGLGFLLSLFITRRWQAALGGKLPFRIMWVAMLLAAAACVPLAFATGATALYVCYGFIGVFMTLASMVFPTALQAISPEKLRSRAAALLFIVSMLLGAAAPPLVGLVSDALRAYPAGPLIAVVALAGPAFLIAAGLLWWCERDGLAATLADAAQSAGTP